MRIPYYRSVLFTKLPQTLPPVTGGAGGDWSLIQQWDTALGDMVAIDAEFSPFIAAKGMAFSPDGTIFSMGDNQASKCSSFSLSTPWDLDTATFIQRNTGIVNGANFRWNLAGTLYMALVIVGDEWRMYPGVNWVPSVSAHISSMTKGDVGFGVGTDGNCVSANDFSYQMWEASTTQGKYITTPGANLNAAATQFTQNPMPIGTAVANGVSPLTVDEKRYIRCNTGSSTFWFMDMNSPHDLPSLSASVLQDISPITFVKPEQCWFNPLDTREVWFAETTGGGANLRICRLATNAII